MEEYKFADRHISKLTKVFITSNIKRIQHSFTLRNNSKRH